MPGMLGAGCCAPIWKPERSPVRHSRPAETPENIFILKLSLHQQKPL